jgi:hypothetical protein
MSRDLRRYSQNTNIRLIVGGLLLLFIVGEGLIYLFYGSSAAISGLICFLMGLSPLLLIWLSLAIMGWIAQRASRD